MWARGKSGGVSRVGASIVAMLMDDMREGRHAERVLDDVRSAVESGVLATPAVFVEGVPLGGWEPSLVEAALRAAT